MHHITSDMDYSRRNLFNLALQIIDNKGSDPKPWSVAAIIFIHETNLKFPALKWQRPSCIQTLSTIISRKPGTQRRFPVLLHELFHDRPIDTSRRDFWNNRNLQMIMFFKNLGRLRRGVKYQCSNQPSIS